MSDFKPRSSFKGEGPLSKFIIPERKINEDRREITFVISSATRDRDGDVIMQNGWNVDHYVKNPVVLWAHDPSQPPIARAKSIRVADNKLISTAVFPDRETYEFGDTVFRLYKGGFLSAVSVGFTPTELELMEGPTPGDIGFRFMKQELHEYSAVPIPSNPEALVLARSHKINVNPMKEWIERTLDEGSAGNLDDLLQKSFIALNGKLHPSLQDMIAKRNADALSKMPAETEDDAGVDEEDKGEEAEVVETGGIDNAEAAEPHTHEVELGASQTEPAEGDGHVHAVNYEEDGEAVIEETAGHSHEGDVSVELAEEADEEKNGDVDSEEEVIEQTEVNDRDRYKPVEAGFTDWPAVGMNLKVSLLTSDYRAYPVAEAKALRQGWPELWDQGEGDDELFEKIAAGDENAIRQRERWAAENVDAWDIAGIISQIKHLVRGSRGIEHMRLELSKAKESMATKATVPTKAREVAIDEDLLIKRILERGVKPAIEAAIRRHSGRLS